MREVKKTFWDFVTISGASLIAVPLMILSESIQARTLGVENYGKITLLYSAISFCFLFGFNWLTTAIIKLGKEEFIMEGHLRKTFSSYLMVTAIMVVPTMLLIFSLKEVLFDFLGINFKGSFLVIFAGVVTQIFKVLVLETLKVVRMLKVQSFLNRLLLKVLMLSGILLLSSSAFNFSVQAIIVVIILSDAIVAIVGLFFIRRKYIFPISIDKKQSFKMIIFALPFFVGAWTNYLINYVDIYTIKGFLNIESVSIYQAAYKTYLTLQILINSSLSVIITPIIIGMNALGQKDKLQMYLKRIVPQGVFILFILISVVLIFVDLFISIVFGSEYDASTTTLKILIASLIGTVIHALTSGFYLAFNMQRKMVLLGLIGGGINLLGDLLVVKPFGVEGVAWVSAFSALIVPLIWFWLISKKMKVKRLLPFYFCFVTFIVLIINLTSLILVFKILITILVFVATLLLSRYFNLFEKDDIQLLNKINMPVKIRKALEWVINILI